MMSMNSNKRKGRPANNSKLGRSKLYNDKAMTFDGVYGNSRLMHAAASLVGCVVEVQVRDGTTYEGILKTFSHQFDLVLEMTHKVSPKAEPPQGIGPSLSNLLSSFPFEEGLKDKLIFRLADIVTLRANNVDADYALKESFTDTAISKYNGQILEKELEPWDGASSDSETTSLAAVEEDCGANGWDANDMFRTNAEKYGVKSSYDTSMQEYTVVLTRKDTEEYKLKEARASQIAHEIEMNMSYQARVQLENGDEEDRFSAVVRPQDDAPNKYVLPQKRRPAPGGPKRPPSGAKPYVPPATSAPAKQFPPPPAKEPAEVSLNGGVPSEPVTEPAPPPAKPYALCHPSSQTLPPRIERRRENERKLSMQKGRNDEIEEFRKFSSNFKLTEESKESCEAREEFSNAENKSSDSTTLANKLAEQVKIEKDTESAKTDISKSTLNPNAKEFVFNPNAKSFTPRSAPAVSPHPPNPNNNTPTSSSRGEGGAPQQQPQRVQAQSPVIVVPHSQMIPQPIFTAMPHPQYALMQPFSATQPPRFRKVPLSMQPRHEITPSMHVAAATGQPILAPAAMPTMQYASPQSVLHTSGPPQQAMGYPQMNFVVGPRVVSPQPVGVVPTSHSVSYCDASHLPAHLLNKYCIAVSAHPSNSLQQQQQQQQQQASHQQQHQHHHPPQSQTPVLHPSPSPVHAQPPALMYSPAGPMGQQQQHALQQQMTAHHQAMTAAHHHHAHHHHHPGYPGAGPQPLVLMQGGGQGGQGGPPPHPPQLHMVQGGHHHVLPQMTLIPTSTATPPYVQHTQGRIPP